MNKLRRIFRSPVTTVVLFAAAVGLLVTGGIGGTRAVLSMTSQNYVAEVQTKDIAIQILENGDAVGEEGLLTGMLGEGETLKVGVRYPEALAVQNKGSIDEYVRVVVYKYWVDEKGTKDNTLDPDLIELNFLTDGKWILDEQVGSGERTILYYSDVLGSGARSDPFTDTVSVSGKLATTVTTETTQTENGIIITETYTYAGHSFVIQAVADGVQTHNAVAAIKSAWGRDVTMSGTTITGLK